MSQQDDKDSQDNQIVPIPPETDPDVSIGSEGFPDGPGHSRDNSIGSIEGVSLLSNETPASGTSTSGDGTDEHTHTNDAHVDSLPDRKAKPVRHPRRVRQTTDSTFMASNRHKVESGARYDGFFDLPAKPEDYCTHQEVLDDLTDDGNWSLKEAPHHNHHAPTKPLTCGRGIVEDFTSTIGRYWFQEMGVFNSKIVAATLFIFFACIAPAVTFGAMYSKLTHNEIGTIEMLLATAWCGIAFALLGGQPIMINGGTGPVLAFSGVLYKLSESIGVPFLTFSAWCGLWVCLYMLVAAFVDLNHVIRYATRFTDEIFALLIAAIFVIDALGSPFHEVGIYYYFKPTHESHEKYEDDPDYEYLEVALLSLTLCVGTTALACFLRGIKHSPYLWWPWLRNGCSDFAVSISILTFALVAHLMFPTIHTEELNVPDTLSPTFQCCDAQCTLYFPDDCPYQEVARGPRPWLVDLLDLQGKAYVPFVAALPAILAFILIFLDNGITVHLLNHPCHKLTHGTAYNYDTVIIGLMIGVNSMLGLPWLVAATVRSLNHVHSLAEKSPDGKVIYSVHETRMTALFAHGLILCSLFALNIIRLVPVPVLYGVFLYMGLTTLGCNQFWNRVLLFFMEPSKYTDSSDEPFLENVASYRIHMYTAIQLFLFLLLYAIKSIKPIAIAFPIVIAACIPVRLYLLPKIFSADELILLDSGDEELIDQWLAENNKRRRFRIVQHFSLEDEAYHHQSICGDLPFENQSVGGHSLGLHTLGAHTV